MHGRSSGAAGVVTAVHVPRWWWIAATAGTAAFAAYVSFVPFEFVHREGGLAPDDIWRRMLDNRGLSRSNIAANVLMFVPFGFFGAAAIARPSSPGSARAVAGLVSIVGLSCMLSVAIEVLQVFVPGRTPSLADIEAQTIGTSIGLVAWLVLGREVTTLAARFVTGSRGALVVVLGGFAAVRFLLLLQPLDVSVELPQIARKFRTGGVVLNPLRSSAWAWDAVPSLLSDVVLAVPVGILAALAFVPPGRRRSIPSAVGLGAAFFVVGELAQIFVRSRTVDVVDVAMSVAGVAAGAALVSMTGRAARAPGERSARPGLLTAALGVAAAIYAAYNLSPFDFDFSRSQVAGRAGMLARVPFQAYYLNQEFKALTDGFLKLSLALPLGLLFQLRWRPDRSPFRRSLTVGWLVLTGAFFLAVEIGQVFLPSRYPDNSDVLLGFAAVWLGMRLARPFGTPDVAVHPDAERRA